MYILRVRMHYSGLCWLFISVSQGFSLTLCCLFALQRKRPWYRAAVSGATNVVIVMQTSGPEVLADASRDVAIQLLQGFSFLDRVNIVTFGTANGGPVSKSPLLPATKKNIEVLERFLDERRSSQSGTVLDYGLALEHAFELFKDSALQEESGGGERSQHACQKV
eukprot:evm.model.scf_319EXC.10 EVM.evm.TU.scf_319EXC.10   scf_319EXC:79153-79932(-)